MRIEVPALFYSFPESVGQAFPIWFNTPLEFGVGDPYNMNVRGQYYITNVSGFGQASIRAPMDDAPFADGALLHDFWAGPRHITIEGIFDLENLFELPCEVRTAVWDGMERDLQRALDFSWRNGSRFFWVWTQDFKLVPDTWFLMEPARSEVPMDVKPTDNYVMRQFNFGLVSSVSEFTTVDASELPVSYPPFGF